MAAKCDICGKNTRKYSMVAGTIICCKTCLNAYLLESYLLQLEERREKDEANNQKAFQQAREMAAWLAVYRYGNARCKKLAAKAINSYMG